VPRASAPIRSVGSPGGAVGNGNAAAYRGSRTRTAPGTAATADADSTAAFRSRRSSSAPLSGSGYPAPARSPRSTSSLQSPGRPGTASGVPDGGSGVASDQRSDAVTARRAVPRGVAPSTPSENSVAPSRRAPDNRSTPDTYSPGISSRPEVYRAVPRSERPAARDNDIYAPTPSYGGVPGGVPDRSYRVPSSPSAPSQDAPDRSRAMPRSGSDGGGSPYGYRAPERSQPAEGSGSRTGPERSAPGPSGPPPSAAPSQPSGHSSGSGQPSAGSGQGRPSGASGGGESRSRSGGSVGRAVPRGGRG
jgi:translation initiation factor IF-2